MEKWILTLILAALIALCSGVFAASESAIQENPSFLCECHAERPGFESADGAQKFCDYGCSCQIFTSSETQKRELELKKLPTTAYSFEDWDRGSHICHGQYAWRPSLSSANWQIQPRFSSFQISNAGSALYADDPVETSPGIEEHLERSADAPEIRDAIGAQLR